jgi:DNA-damage-inducible protein D
MGDIEKQKSLIVFQNKNIRRTWHKDEWWFSVVDVVNALTDSENPRNYWNMLKIRECENGIELNTICVQLKLISSDGKQYLTDCSNTEGLFRIIQSIPSKKAEPFKLWLAKVGYDRVKEIEDPEKGQQRIRNLYRAKGYSEEWIEKRIRGIAIRDELTEEWKERGVKEHKDFSILTSEISKATFDMTPKEYKEHKKLKHENLRDHMDELELIFTMLGEKVTTEISKTEKPKYFENNKEVAKKGGTIAGNARKETEIAIGRKVATKDNYLEIPEKKKKLLKSKTCRKIKYMIENR